MSKEISRINNWIFFYSVILLAWITIVLMALEGFVPNNANIVKIVVEICNSSISDLNLIGVFFYVAIDEYCNDVTYYNSHAKNI
ncbi:MAG: hypothetical protein ACJZ8K_04350 [Paracoccaceae bacterium]